jgi:Mrp family chromosome partitioning ATPase
LITFFDLNNLTHKPKLVAVTSCSEGAGVSTVATGLAASLSETGEGNVLLVNMGEKNGAVHQFYKGDLACGLDDALEAKNRENALVQGNLYVVSEATETNGNGMPLPLPRRFKHLMPKLKASDYDYIIFDMPAVSQVSPTPRLARFMDFVVLVVESESTSREVAKQACGLLSESKTNVGVVLNKGRNYLPKWLNQDL